MKHKLKIIFGSLVIVLIFVFLFLIFLSRDETKADLNNFARCLADKGVIMYGAEWCSHCQAQKQLFGQSFEYVNYVECPQDPKKCLGVGIEGYPTWITAGGEKLIGEQSLETLSQKTNCSLPVETYQP